MYRIILFLVLIALAAAGAAWVADQSGDVVLSWDGWRVATTLPVFALALGIAIVAAMLAWSLIRALWRTPEKIRRSRRERRAARGRHAITHGLLAIGHGDPTAARAHADVARKHAAHDPLALLLHAQSAQLDGDREGARAAFRAMAEREDTRLLGLRGLFIEAQRADDPHSAVMLAEEALKLAPASTWASQAVLGFRCSRGDWSGALAILDNNLASGLIGKAGYRRQRGVLLTARALELETVDRDRSRECVMEAIKLAPTLVPAAALAGKYQSEAHQVRRAMRIVETAWLAQPHPDLADAYAHVKLGDSARQRLVRVETLAAKAPGHLESALAVARAAIDASEFARAREALAPFTTAPTQRVALLMAEIERNEHGDSGRARAWTLRAVRALHDPVWTADGYVSDRWRPVSPVSGRLDAFQWQTPLAALPSDKNAAIESSAFEQAMLAPRRVEPPQEPLQEPSAEPTAPPVAAQDNSPAHSQVPVPPASASVEPAPAAVPASPPPAEPPSTAPLFRARADLGKTGAASVPPVIPLGRPPDDPGIDDEPVSDEFAEPIHPAQGQAGGWRGFLSRWGG
jgi:HemY protein